MEIVSGKLTQRMKSILQIGENAPSVKVVLVNTREPNKAPYMMNNVISLDIDRRIESGAAECNIVFENFLGKHSPDYAPFKFPNLNLPRSGYEQVLWPYNMVVVFLGYGDVTTKVFTGFIDKIDIISNDSQIKLIARDVWSKLVDTIIEPLQVGSTNKYLSQLEYKNVFVSTVIADLISKAIKDPNSRYFPNVIIDNVYEDILIFESKNINSSILFTLSKGESFVILEQIDYEWMKVSYNEITGYIYTPYNVTDELSLDYIKFDLGQSYEEAVKQLLSAVNMVGFGTRDGNIRCMFEPQYSDNQIAHHTFEDWVNINSNEYHQDSIIIRNRLIVASADKWEAFQCTPLLQLTNNYIKTAKVNMPWAKTHSMRKSIAQSIFAQTYRKFRRMTTGIIGDPTLDLFDLVQYEEVVSTAAMKYKILSIRTSFSDMGYFDMIDTELASLNNETNVIILDYQYAFQDSQNMEFTDTWLDEESKSFSFDLKSGRPVNKLILSVINKEDNLVMTRFEIDPQTNQYTSLFSLTSEELERMDTDFRSSSLWRLTSWLSNGVTLTSFRYLPKVGNKFEFTIENLRKYLYPQYNMVYDESVPPQLISKTLIIPEPQPCVFRVKLEVE